jgi:transposase
MKNHIVLCVHESVPVLKAALKKSRDQAFKTRLKAIILRSSGKSPQEIAESLVVSDRSVTSWILRYNAEGITGLTTKPSGRSEGNPKWEAEPFEKLTKEIDKGGYWSIPKMQEWITEHYKKYIPEQTIWYRMDQLSYSYKSARPHPVQGNKDKQEAFKKGALLRSWSR